MISYFYTEIKHPSSSWENTSIPSEVILKPHRTFT